MHILLLREITINGRGADAGARQAMKEIKVYHLKTVLLLLIV